MVAANRIEKGKISVILLTCSNFFFFSMVVLQIFLFQHMTYIGERSRHTSTDGANEYGSNVYCIPNYADLLVFQASYHGHYSFRSGSGTWFIQALCDEVFQMRSLRLN